MDCCASLDPTAQPLDVLLLLGMGLTISLGHCVGMCGPLVSVFAVSQRGRGIGAVGLLVRSLLYHLGRVLSYGVIGVIMGWLGETVLLADEGKVIQAALSILVAVLMLLLGVGLAGWLPTTRWLEAGGWANTVSCRIKNLLAAESLPKCFALGVVNGWLPCGPVFAAAITAAATGNPWKGAAAMLLFGAGTVPVLIALSMGTGQLRASARLLFHRVGAGFVVLIGVQLLLRGLAALGVVGHLRFGEFVVF